MVRVLVLRSAGANCDQETQYAFASVGARADLVHINRLVSGTVSLRDYQILAIPGGFSYGDDISGGKILANELKYKLADSLKDFYESGKLIIGICNGFQVLVKAGLLPAVAFTAPQSVTLTYNDSGKFEDRWVHLKVNETGCVFTKNIKNIVYFPVAHAEGKFVVQDQSVLDELKKKRQIVFQYANADGGTAQYPENPNGSMAGIAGICDPSGRVMGLMPHPERHFSPLNHPQWTRTGLAPEGDGVAVFRNAVEYCAG
jgi:phosphoribosylformylglycinamidine synthase subunit PurQ / glutaminase